MCSFPVNISLKTHALTRIKKAPKMGFHRCQMAKKKINPGSFQEFSSDNMINMCFFSFQYHIKNTCKSSDNLKFLFEITE